MGGGPGRRRHRPPAVSTHMGTVAGVRSGDTDGARLVTLPSPLCTRLWPTAGGSVGETPLSVWGRGRGPRLVAGVGELADGVPSSGGTRAGGTPAPSGGPACTGTGSGDAGRLAGPPAGSRGPLLAPTLSPVPAPHFPFSPLMFIIYPILLGCSCFPASYLEAGSHRSKKQYV